MSLNSLSRRSLLKAGGALAGMVAMPAIVRADTKEIVVGGPAGAAKYFNGDLFPVLEKQLNAKVLYEGSNSLTNLQKMTADKAAPKMSVVIMDDPVMIPAADGDLITAMSAKSIPNLDKLVPGAVHRDGLWANYQKPWAGIAYSKTRMPTAPKSWTEMYDPKYAQKIIVPSLQNTEGFWNSLVAAHLETGKPYAEAQYEVDAGFRKLKSLKPNLLNVYTNAPQAMNLLEQGEAWMIGGQFSAYTLTRTAAMVRRSISPFPKMARSPCRQASPKSPTARRATSRTLSSTRCSALRRNQFSRKRLSCRRPILRRPSRPASPTARSCSRPTGRL